MVSFAGRLVAWLGSVLGITEEKSMGVTPLQFSQALLGQLGLPISSVNVEALVAWCAFEGGHYHNGARFNPLNTTMPAPGSVVVIHQTPTSGIRAYPDWATGLEATVKTLRNGLYGAILAALAASSDPAVTLAAIKASPWGTYNVVPGEWPQLQAYGNTPDPVGGGFGNAALGLVLLGGAAAAWWWLGNRS